MVSVLTRKQERAVDGMVRLAGGEEAFQSAVERLTHDRGRAPEAKELLDYLLDRRIAELKSRIEGGIKG